MKIILQRLITYQFWEWRILFFKAIARDVTFIIEFFVHVRYFLTLPILPYFVFDMSVTLPGHAAHNISFLMVDEIRQH